MIVLRFQSTAQNINVMRVQTESDPRITIVLLKEYWTTFLMFHLIRLPARRMEEKVTEIKRCAIRLQNL